MSRRGAALLGALVLAIGGTVALVLYVSTAEKRALAGERLVEVLVVAEPIAAGTPVEELSTLVTLEQVPIKVQAQGAVADLTGMEGRVVGMDLLPGDQLVTSRLVSRQAIAQRQIGIELPDDMVEVTIELDAQRSVGGLVTAGSTVAVLVSFQPAQVTETVRSVDGESVPVPASAGDQGVTELPNSTNFLLNKVLVTAVQEPGGASRAPDDRVTAPPAGSVFVTMAVDVYDAERLIYAAEFGSLWLAVERETVPDVETPGQTRDSVLNEPGQNR